MGESIHVHIMCICVYMCRYVHVRNLFFLSFSLSLSLSLSIYIYIYIYIYLFFHPMVDNSMRPTWLTCRKWCWGWRLRRKVKASFGIFCSRKFTPLQRHSISSIFLRLSRCIERKRREGKKEGGANACEHKVRRENYGLEQSTGMGSQGSRTRVLKAEKKREKILHIASYKTTYVNHRDR